MFTEYRALYLWFYNKRKIDINEAVKVVVQMSNSASKDDSIMLAALLQYFISYLHREFLAVVYGLELVLQTSENTSEKQTLAI